VRCLSSTQIVGIQLQTQLVGIQLQSIIVQVAENGLHDPSLLTMTYYSSINIGLHDQAHMFQQGVARRP
jgi:hypothetical protein